MRPGTRSDILSNIALAVFVAATCYVEAGYPMARELTAGIAGVFPWWVWVILLTACAFAGRLIEMILAWGDWA